jgi:hypothetical protein
VLVNLYEGRRRLEYLRRDPRLSLTILAPEGGTATSRSKAPSYRWSQTRIHEIDRLVRHYTGTPFQSRRSRQGQRMDRGRAIARVGLGSVHGGPLTEAALTDAPLAAP